MKKQLLFVVLCLGLSLSVNAQNQKTTEAVPIANGCGSENSPASKVGAAIANPLDVIVTAPLDEPLAVTYMRILLGGAIDEQIQSCDIHDKDYYHGVPKAEADGDFAGRSPIKGVAVMAAQETSQEAYDAAQEERRRSEELQPTWEEENQACLDSENYKVVEIDVKEENQTYINQENGGQTDINVTVSKEEIREKRRNKIRDGYNTVMNILDRLAR